MIRKLILLSAMVVLLFSLSNGTVLVDAAGKYDCPTVRQVCRDIWLDGMYQLCVATTGDPSTCQIKADSAYMLCVAETSEGTCPLD